MNKLNFPNFILLSILAFFLMVSSSFSGYDDCLPGARGYQFGLTHTGVRTCQVYVNHMIMSDDCCNHNILDQQDFFAYIDLDYQVSYWNETLQQWVSCGWQTVRMVSDTNNCNTHRFRATIPSFSDIDCTGKCETKCQCGKSTSCKTDTIIITARKIGTETCACPY
jgi:hypothetical protein